MCPQSLPLLAPRLPEAQRGRELPPLLCRLQGDALGPLRCNATLCLGRVAPLLPPTVSAHPLPAPPPHPWGPPYR